jgi:hypothetical protein
MREIHYNFLNNGIHKRILFIFISNVYFRKGHERNSKYTRCIQDTPNPEKKNTNLFFFFDKKKKNTNLKNKKKKIKERPFVPHK